MRQWYLACNTFPPGAALTLVGQGEALCLVSPSVALSAHLVKQPLQVGEALLGQEARALSSSSTGAYSCGASVRAPEPATGR